MKTIYIDENFMCHAENAAGRRKVETENMGVICNEALEYYRFVPKGETWQGGTCTEDFIQCINSAGANEAWSRFYAAHPQPTAPEGYEYRLNDALVWELHEIPTEEE